MKYAEHYVEHLIRIFFCRSWERFATRPSWFRQSRLTRVTMTWPRNLRFSRPKCRKQGRTFDYSMTCRWFNIQWPTVGARRNPTRWWQRLELSPTSLIIFTIRWTRSAGLSSRRSWTWKTARNGTPSTPFCGLLRFISTWWSKCLHCQLSPSRYLISRRSPGMRLN